ncbi:hypothetical protein BGX21_003466, partial [Mortierella sp. AD011]
SIIRFVKAIYMHLVRLNELNPWPFGFDKKHCKGPTWRPTWGLRHNSPRHVSPPEGWSIYDSNHNLDNPNIARRFPGLFTVQVEVHSHMSKERKT